MRVEMDDAIMKNSKMLTEILLCIEHLEGTAIRTKDIFTHYATNAEPLCGDSISCTFTYKGQSITLEMHYEVMRNKELVIELTEIWEVKWHSGQDANNPVQLSDNRK